MKRNPKFLIKNVIFLLVLLKMCTVFCQPEDRKKIIVIDPGHGGFDSGAIGINNLQEKDVTLKIALEMIKLNKTILNNDLDIYLTRYCDTFISLRDRGRLAKLLEAKAFVSIHCNASRTGSFGKGMEVFVHNSNTQANNINFSNALAISILNESIQNLYFENRGVKYANFQVLRETIAFLPSVLVEIGFVTNPDEADYFLKPKNIRAMALSILLGLFNYLNEEL